MEKYLRSVIGFCVLTLFCWNFAFAQGEVVAVALAGKRVGDIINQINLAGASLLSQADNSGNAMISHGANEANVLAKNLSFQFRDRLDQTFDRLGDDEKLLLIESESLRQTVLKLSDKAYDAKDTMAIDLNYLLDRFPFVSQGFFLQAVRGIAYFQRASDYEMKVFASTLGIQEGVKTTVTVSIGGHPIPAVVDQSQQRGLAYIRIPYGELAKYFKEYDLALVPASLKFEVVRKKGRIIKTDEKEGPFEVPLTLSLYPNKVAIVSPTSRVPRYAWVGLGQKKVSKDTPDRGKR